MVQSGAARHQPVRAGLPGAVPGPAGLHTRAERGLATLTGQRRHEQWLDDIPYAEVDLSHVVGHRQVTDAYLAQLARSRGGRVATVDRGFAAAAPDVVDLVPT